MFDKCSMKIAKSDAISNHPSCIVLTYDPLDGCFLTHSLSESRQLLTSALVAELMQCTIWEVRDQVHRGELPAVRWGQQFRFFREEVLAVLLNRPAGPNEVE
jgi:excisionase family DNA binding protein